MKDWNSLLGGYSCLVIGVTGTLVNVMVLVVLTSETKLSSQPTTAILVVITLLNILYNGLILPAQAVMYLERRWAVTVLSALYDISLKCLLSLDSLVPNVCLLLLRPHGKHPVRSVCPRSQQVLVCVHSDQVRLSLAHLTLNPVFRLTRAQAYLVSLLSCLLPSALLVFPASGWWGRFGYMEDTGQRPYLSLDTSQLQEPVPSSLELGATAFLTSTEYSSRPFPT